MAYDKDRNYAQEIADAISSGASQQAVQELQDARNEKISANSDHYSSLGISNTDKYGSAADAYINDGYGGGSPNSSNGSYNSFSKFSYDDAPTYTNKYQSQIDDLAASILNRDAFSYDPEQDETYQQYKESYTKSGQRAMQDTIGQVSARTGGLASSYAGSVSQQTYDNYMSALADKIPELKQLAYSMYQDEGNTQRANLEMLQALESGDYAKYQDLLSQYNTDRGFDYGVYSDDRNYDYQVGRDEISDKQYADETAYNRQTYEDETEYSQALQKAQTLAAAGDFSGYKALGYTDAEISNLKTAYDKAQAASAASSSKKSSSGSGSGKELTAAQAQSAIKNGTYTNSTLSSYDEYYGDGAFLSYLKGTDSYVSNMLNNISSLSDARKLASIKQYYDKGYYNSSVYAYLLDYYGLA